jgi:teichuronic acid biosynthesis glycosyltransferase TuaG
MNKPLVSIITPAFNCKDTIKETYESIKSQTFESWEWIVVEDHSKDDTFEYIKELIKDDNQVVLLQTDKNSGAAVARNLGIEKASGKYIAFLDSDDLWKKNCLIKFSLCKKIIIFSRLQIMTCFIRTVK